jgi:hypothetical protein
MVNHFSVKEFQVIINPGENIGKILHEIDVVLFDLRTKRFL